MFLKSLSLRGFKSFAEPATLRLEPGVTVVVGPNGSGKSNVVDAIGWVLGAQAPSALRSQKMDDVIFAGTSKRAPLGRAEVSLTIDNSDQLLPIEFVEVTITRTLYRSGDSEYAINGAPVRLLDIQELLSDSGVGRQQHVIVSQGQIDAVLNAKAEDRRAIIEEAAGVLKFRRRKEKAQRRLSSTEANFLRCQDLLREVRRQLKPLERQADAARRHGEVVAELTALRLYVAGREIARLRRHMADLAQREREQRAVERDARSQLVRLDTSLVAVEAQLDALGADRHSDDLVRYESLRQRARGLLALLDERSRGIARDRDTFVDHDVIASLEAERVKLSDELDALSNADEEVATELAEVEGSEAALDVARAEFRDAWGDEVVTHSGEAAEVRGELAALAMTIDRATSEQDRHAGRVAALSDRIASAEGALVQLDTEHPAVMERRQAASAAHDMGAERVATAEADLDAAVERLAVASESRQHWSARRDALAQALDLARRAAGLDRVAAIDGVLGTILDVVTIDEGWDAAVESALGAVLTAVLVKDSTSARRVLSAFEEAGQLGAVLALAELRPSEGVFAPVQVAGAAPLRQHVRSTIAAVSAALDVLLADHWCVDAGWATALDCAEANPSATIVSRSGDRFSADGWRLGSASAGATGAALEEAQSEAERAEAEWEAARHTRDRARDERRAALDAQKAARVEHQGALAALERWEAERSRLTAVLQQAAKDHAAATADGEASSTPLRAALERRAALEVRLPALEAREAEVKERSAAMAAQRRTLDERSRSVGVARNAVDGRLSALAAQRAVLSEQLTAVTERLDRNRAQQRLAARRVAVLDARGRVTRSAEEVVSRHVEVIDERVARLVEARRRHSENARSVTGELEAIRERRGAAGQNLEAARLEIQRVEIAVAEARLRLDTVVERLRAETDLDVDAALAAEPPELPDGVSASARLKDVERDLRRMGPINPLALGEFEALQERHAFLEGQLDDIRTTRRDLSKVIRAVDEEIVSLFSAAYADVSANFTALFDALFPGGHGALRLTEPDDPLETGIEIEARPSGKNVRKLSLLSGGERSLTALAYLFAVFRSRPSPFYVMDEVEAALDDVNLSRFIELVGEFRDSAQLVIVSHQKRTMEAADVLYGVTMEPGGSSKVLSEKPESVLDRTGGAVLN